jgi:hypothetical protein
MTPTPSKIWGKVLRHRFLGESGVAEEKVFHARGELLGEF